jgi:hypothetical protein
MNRIKNTKKEFTGKLEENPKMYKFIYESLLEEFDNIGVIIPDRDLIIVRKRKRQLEQLTEDNFTAPYDDTLFIFELYKYLTIGEK